MADIKERSPQLAGEPDAQPRDMEPSDPEPERRGSIARRQRPPRYQESDTEDVDRDMEPRRRRNRPQRTQQARGPVGGVQEIGDTVHGVGDLVQNTANNAVGGVTNTAGRAVGGVVGGEQKQVGGKKEKDEQLRLRLDLNLDVEVQLKAKIHGDLTLGLL